MRGRVQCLSRHVVLDAKERNALMLYLIVYEKTAERRVSQDFGKDVVVVVSGGKAKIGMNRRCGMNSVIGFIDVLLLNLKLPRRETCRKNKTRCVARACPVGSHSQHSFPWIPDSSKLLLGTTPIHGIYQSDSSSSMDWCCVALDRSRIVLRSITPEAIPVIKLPTTVLDVSLRITSCGVIAGWC